MSREIASLAAKFLEKEREHLAKSSATPLKNL